MGSAHTRSTRAEGMAAVQGPALIPGSGCLEMEWGNIQMVRVCVEHGQAYGCCNLTDTPGLHARRAMPAVPWACLRATAVVPLPPVQPTCDLSSSCVLR
jgi:hypothetical protein